MRKKRLTLDESLALTPKDESVINDEKSNLNGYIEKLLEEHAKWLSNNGLTVDESGTVAEKMRGVLQFWGCMVSIAINAIKNRGSSKDKYSTRINRKNQTLEAAIDWIFNYDTAVKFDFICEVTCLDPETIRKQLRPYLKPGEEIL